MSGRQFTAGHTVDVSFDAAPLTNTVVAADGTIAISVIVPASATPGAHDVAAIDRQTASGAHATFTVDVDWPSFRDGPRHLGWNRHENVLGPSTVAGLAVDWSFTTGDQVFASPAVVDGVVYVGSHDRKFYALNAETGAVKWSAATGSRVRSSAAVAGGVVYVGSFDNKIYAFRCRNRRLAGWTVTTGGDIRSSPTVAGGVVYVGSDDHKLYALDAVTGMTRWAATTGAAVRSAPAVANNVVYVGSDDHKLYALDVVTGMTRWTATTGLDIRSAPAVAGNVVYVGSFDHSLYAFDAATGAKRWSKATGDVVFSGPAVAGGVVYVGSEDSSLYAFDAGTGALRWSRATGAFIGSSPAVANGVVYVGSTDHKVYGLDAATGAVRWSATTGDLVESSPAVVNGKVFVGSLDHKLYVFGLPYARFAGWPDRRRVRLFAGAYKCSIASPILVATFSGPRCDRLLLAAVALLAAFRARRPALRPRSAVSPPAVRGAVLALRCRARSARRPERIGEGSRAPPPVSLDLLETVSGAAGLGGRVLHATLGCGDADSAASAPLLPCRRGRPRRRSRARLARRSFSFLLRNGTMPNVPIEHVFRIRPIEASLSLSDEELAVSLASTRRVLAADRALRAAPSTCGAPLDALALRLGVQLLARAASGSRAGAEPATPARRDVVDRCAASLHRFGVPGPLLVDGACRDRLGDVLGPAAGLEDRLHVLVLTLTFVIPNSKWHTANLRRPATTGYQTPVTQPSGF